VNFSFARTICRSDNLVDISDAADLTYITQVRIVNSSLSNTPDGFDVDGVIALHNCEAGEGVIDSGEIAERNMVTNSSELKIFPNPAETNVFIHMRSAAEERVFIELRDINGRLVANLFEGEMMEGESRRLEFQVNQFAPGIYLMHMRGGSQSEVSKLIITE
jgi:hypothetical protein